MNQEHPLHYDIYRQQLRPLQEFLLALTLLLLVNLGLELEHSLWTMRTWNWVFPLLLMGLSFVTAFRLFRTEALLLWTPTPWFLAAVVTYCGMGTLIFSFGSEESLEYISIIWTLSVEDLWYTNMLNLVGVLSITSGLLIGILMLPKFKPRKASTSMSNQRAKEILVVFLAAGLPVRYLLALPYELGLSTFVLPGAVFALRDLVLVAILMLGYLSVREGGRWNLFFVVLLTTEILVNLLLFSKLSFITVLVMAALGRFLGGRKLSTLLIAGVILSTVYFTLIPVFGEARILVYQKTGRVAQASIGDRLGVIQEAVKKVFQSTDDLQGHLQQGWWIRFSMNNVQAFAMDQYDSGIPGDSLKMAVYTFIPRILWEDKPIITSVGVEFSDLVIGMRTTSTGIGVFGEAYWNGGWLAVVWTSFLIGLIFALLSQIALLSMSREEWIFLPCIFLGIRMGFRIDGWFAADYIGSFVFYVYFLVFLSIVNLFWTALQKQR
jgi:hypothetical protein